MDDATNETLEDLPPSAKLVFKVLQYDGPLTQRQIIEASMLSGRTVRDAIGRLEEVDAVESGVYPGDARKNLYRTTREEVTDPTKDCATCAD